MNKVFKQVPRILYGNGTLQRLTELLPQKDTVSAYYLYIVDDIHRQTGLIEKFHLDEEDLLICVDIAEHEPTTRQVDELRDKILASRETLPLALIAIGGGSVMDIGKAVSIMLTNEGTSAAYQGWDLVRNPPIFKVGVPTLSGTGAEASRTAVLTGPDKKMGINSDYSMFDAVLSDPDLVQTVPREQRFFTAMDCYIHCVESLEGTMINELSRSYAAKGLELCREVFIGEGDDGKLMVASYLGGCSIVNSEVGICHALSYGLSLELGLRHGLANCIAFNVLDDYYGDYVREMRQMVGVHGIKLPKDVTRALDAKAIERMMAMAVKMEKPLTNALGVNWAKVLTREVIFNLYSRM